MRWLLGLVMVCVIGCTGNPVGPDGAQELFEWTVDGQTYTATANGRGALRSGATISVAGASCGSGAILNVLIGTVGGPGTFAVSGSQGVNFTWTPDARTGTAANENWSAPGPTRVVNNQFVRDGSGTVSVTRMTNDWISGTFSAEVFPGQQNRDMAPKRLQGRFELSFRERTIC